MKCLNEYRRKTFQHEEKTDIESKIEAARIDGSQTS